MLLKSKQKSKQQTANSKQQGLLGDAPIPASLANRPVEGNLRVRVNLSSAVSHESPVRAWVLTITIDKDSILKNKKKEAIIVAYYKL